MFDMYNFLPTDEHELRSMFYGPGFIYKPNLPMMIIPIFDDEGDLEQAIQDVYRDSAEELFRSVDSSIREQRKKDGLCLECGSKGEWINMVLVCNEHGRIAG